jgi:hypothetical protein
MVEIEGTALLTMSFRALASDGMPMRPARPRRFVRHAEGPQL